MSTRTDTASPVEATIAIVGVGLIGGSIAAAVKKRHVAAKVIGVGRNRARLETARSRGLIDAETDELAAAAAEAKLIVFCTPVDRIIEGVRTAAAACQSGTLLTDAGSVKGKICGDLQAEFPTGATFIGSHPLAGSEKQGFEFASADLFEDRVCVITPTESTPRGTIGRVSAFWRALGANVREMSPAAHDCALAETSHFPHLAASALASTLCEANRALAASGFRDTTRVAAGDPELWVDILMQNAPMVMASLDKYARTLNAFRHALRARDAADLKRLLEVGKQSRDSL